MGPCKPIDDGVYGVSRDAMFPGEGRLCSSIGSFPDSDNLVIRELSQSLSGASRPSASLDAIASVVELVTQLEVHGVAAGRVVAFMPDDKSNRDCAMDYLPGYAMSYLAAALETNESIRQLLATLGCASARLPFPAASRSNDVDFAPKPCDSFCVHGNHPSRESGPGRVAATRGSLVQYHAAEARAS